MCVCVFVCVCVCVCIIPKVTMAAVQVQELNSAVLPAGVYSSLARLVLNRSEAASEICRLTPRPFRV